MSRRWSTEIDVDAPVEQVRAVLADPSVVGDWLDLHVLRPRWRVGGGVVGAQAQVEVQVDGGSWSWRGTAGHPVRPLRTRHRFVLRALGPCHTRVSHEAAASLPFGLPPGLLARTDWEAWHRSLDYEARTRASWGTARTSATRPPATAHPAGVPTGGARHRRTALA